MKYVNFITKLFGTVDNLVYIFHHIPKCGGTTVRNSLKKWFKLELDYITMDQLRGIEPIHPPKDLKKLNGNHCLCGHYEISRNHLEIRYPEIFKYPNKYRVFTFIRDPLELRKSLYYFEIKMKNRNPDSENLEKYLLTGENYLANRIPCNFDNYHEKVNQYFFIGLQENLQQSMNMLADLIGRSKVKVSTQNISTRDDQESGFNDDFLIEFKRKNELDYLIYNYVKHKFFNA